MEGHREFIDTGSDVADQILFVLLSTSMFVAGFIGFVLDNTIPGKTLDSDFGFVDFRGLNIFYLDFIF